MKKRKIILFAAVCMSSLLLLFLYQQYTYNRPIKYKNFGIRVPAGYTTHGIDVSRYQRMIQWKDVSEMRDKGQRISFAIAKCTEGTNMIDAYYKKNWENMEAHNMIRGAYMYFHANRDATEQANYFIKHAQLKTGDLPPIIDIEDTHRMKADEIRKALQTCADVLEKEYKTKPIIYSGADFYEKLLGEQFIEYPLWVAHYQQPNAPRISRQWTIWQHNCKGRVNGIIGDVDFNVVNGNVSTLKSLCL